MNLNEATKELAKDFLKRERQILANLIQMKQEGWFERLGYRGVFEYVIRELRLSEAQAFYYQKVVGKSAEVPRLSQAVVNGELSLSKARRLIPVVTKTNCEEWIGRANELKQRELEAAVAESNPTARVKERVKPVGPKLIEMTIAITPEVAALLKQVKDLESQRTKSDASWNDSLRATAETYLEKNDPIRKAKRVSSRTAPTPKPGRHAVPASLQHEVNLRDGRQCTEKYQDGTRCGERKWLELDHVIPVSQGGLNTLQNLRTLCAFHHRGRHKRERVTTHGEFARPQSG